MCGKPNHIAKYWWYRHKHHEDNKHDRTEDPFVSLISSDGWPSRFCNLDSNYSADNVVNRIMRLSINDCRIVDSGESAHLSYQRDWFHEVTPSVDTRSVVWSAMVIRVPLKEQV